jgi:hypothetical protein
MELVELMSDATQINSEIAYLLSLAQDSQKQGELIENFDPILDKIDSHVLYLQNRITEELDKKSKEFTLAIAQASPPSFLSDQDIDKWHKLAALKDGSVKLATFKKTLIINFKNELHRQLAVEKLTEQNITIRLILDKLRQLIMI